MNIEILKPLTDETNKTWNLSSDEKLLNVLKLFSNEITKSTQACTEYMHDLNYSLNETETSLRNTFNEFIMLGNSQFIENRVYDDDEEDDEEQDQIATVTMDMTTSSALASSSSSVVSSGTIQQNTMTNLKDAYQLGQKALKLFYYDSNFLHQEDKIEDIYNIRPLPYIIGTKSYLNSTDAGLGGINVYDDDHDDDDVRGVDDSKSTAGGGGAVVVVEHGANVLAIDAATPTPNSETGSNDFKPPPANKPSFPPPPPTAPRTVTSALFQSVVNPNDHDHNDTDDKDDTDDNTLPLSQSSAPSTLPPSYPSKVPPPPPQQQLLPPTTHQPSSLVPPPLSSSQPSSTVPPSIPIKSNNIQDILNQKFSEKNTQKPIDQVQNPVVSLNNTAVNKVTDDTKGTEEVIIKNNEYKVGKVDEDDDEDEDEDLFASKDDPFKLFGNKAAPKMNIRNSLGDLFGDNDINGSGGLFGRGIGTGVGGGGSRTSRGSFSSLFGDSNDDILFDDVPKSRGSISNNSSTNNSPNKVKTTNFDDLFGDSKFASTLTNNKSDTTSTTTTSNANNNNLSKEVSDVKPSDLFGSNNNDDIFNTIIGTNKTVNTKSPMKTRFSSLFGDDDDDSLFAQKDKRKDEASIKSANNINSKSIRNSLFDDNPSATNTNRKKSVFDDDDHDDDDDFKVVVPTASTIATAYNNNDSGSSTVNDSALALSSVAPAAVVRERLPIPLIPNRNSGHYDEDDDDDDDDDDNNNDDDDKSGNRAANSKDQSSQLNIAGIKSVPSLSLSSSLSSQVPTSTSNNLKSLFNDDTDNDSHGNNDTDDIQNDGIKTNHNTSPLLPVVASIKQSIPIPLPSSNRNVQSFHDDDDDNKDDNSGFDDNDDEKGHKNMKENSVILSSSSNNDLEDVVATSSSRKEVSSKISALMSNIDPTKLQMMIPGQKNISVLNNKNNYSSSHDSSSSNDDNDDNNDENSYGDKAKVINIESSIYEQVETNEDELNKITLSRATNNTNKTKRAPSKKAFIVNDVDNDDNSNLLSSDDKSNIVESSSTSNSLKLTMSSSLFGDDNAVSISQVAVQSSLFADVDNDVSSGSKKVIKSSLFGDDNYDDNNDNRLNTNSNLSATSSSLLGSVSGKSKKAIKSNLFEDDTNNYNNNEIVFKKTVKSSLFDDNDDNITTTSSLFGDINDANKVIIKSKEALKSSLFLDDDNNVSSPSSKLKKSSLFDDDDDDNNNDFLTVKKTLKQQKGGLFD